MKWIVIVVVVLVLAGAVWLRTARQPPPPGGSGGPHRLDDSLSDQPHVTPEPDEPSRGAPDDGPDQTPSAGPPTT